MSKLFICYRRDDSGASCGHIYERLSNHFGSDTIFKDVENIPYGARFSDVLTKQLAACRVELVVIGRYWLSATTPDGTRRLDAPDDFVRAEIEFGIRNRLIVVPLLVDHATLPRADQLPFSIRELVEFQTAQMRNDPDFNTDMQRLIRQLERWLGVTPPVETRKAPLPVPPDAGEVDGYLQRLAPNAPFIHTADAEALQAQIERLLVEVSAVGEGDLRVQAEVTPDTLGVLADSFNFMIEELAKVVGSVQMTTNQVAALAQRMLEINRDVDRQANTVVEIAKVASEPAQTSVEVAIAMGRITEIMRQTHAAIQDFDAALQHMDGLSRQLRASVATFLLPDHIAQEVRQSSTKW